MQCFIFEQCARRGQPHHASKFGGQPAAPDSLSGSDRVLSTRASGTLAWVRSVRLTNRWPSHLRTRLPQRGAGGRVRVTASSRSRKCRRGGPSAAASWESLLGREAAPRSFFPAHCSGPACGSPLLWVTNSEGLSPKMDFSIPKCSLTHNFCKYKGEISEPKFLAPAAPSACLPRRVRNITLRSTK